MTTNTTPISTAEAPLDRAWLWFEDLKSKERLLDPEGQLARAGTRLFEAELALAELEDEIASAQAQWAQRRTALLKEARAAKAEHGKLTLLWRMTRGRRAAA
jgi:hypothetical protein